MAQKTVVIVTDDLTGEETQSAKTHTFAVNGAEYEIDLSDTSFDKFMEALSPFMDAGRRRRKTRGGGVTAKQDTAKIREWAKEQGYEVSDRGRVPYEIAEAYNASKQQHSS